jgi:hypothetical protein
VNIQQPGVRCGMAPPPLRLLDCRRWGVLARRRVDGGEMTGEAGLADWLLAAGQGLLVVLFAVFFYLVIRLWLGMTRPGSAYNSGDLPRGGEVGRSGSVTGSEKPLTDQGNKP